MGKKEGKGFDYEGNTIMELDNNGKMKKYYWNGKIRAEVNILMENY